MNSIKIDLGYISPATSQTFSLLPSTTRRRKLNLMRSWNALSKLQRNLLLFLSTVSFLVIFVLIFRRMTRHSTSMENLDSITTESPAIFKKDDPISSIQIVSESAQLDKSLFRFKGPENEKQRAVVEAFKHAWKNYKQFAWGHDHLLPLSQSYGDWFGLGLTIVDNLDTLLIMNLKEEFNDARHWVETLLNFDADVNVNFFETTIRVLGGLLSAYHLNNKDELFLTKALQLGQKLKGAFDTPHKIPYPDVNLKHGTPKLASWTTDSSLSEITTVQLEFRELSRLTGDLSFEELAFNVSLHLHELGCKKYDGLCPMYVNTKKGQFTLGGAITTGARTDSFYEYLLKQYLQTGQKIHWLKNDYLQFVKGLKKHLLKFTNGQRRLRYVGEILAADRFSPKMDHLVCFLPGTLALGALHKLPYSKMHLKYAQDLARTCRAMYDTPTGLAPEIVHFSLQSGNDTKLDEEIFIKSADAHSLLRPEAVEAWFYLFRATGDPIYQEWGWQMFQALEKYARVKNGFSSVVSVKQVPAKHLDKMESFFLAETLKYLFLLLADDQTILPLDRFVYNTEAHPLPIRDN